MHLLSLQNMQRVQPTFLIYSGVNIDASSSNLGKPRSSSYSNLDLGYSQPSSSSASSLIMYLGRWNLSLDILIIIISSSSSSSMHPAMEQAALHLLSLQNMQRVQPTFLIYSGVNIDASSSNLGKPRSSSYSNLDLGYSQPSSSSASSRMG